MVGRRSEEVVRLALVEAVPVQVLRSLVVLRLVGVGLTRTYVIPRTSEGPFVPRCPPAHRTDPSTSAGHRLWVPRGSFRFTGTTGGGGSGKRSVNPSGSRQRTKRPERYPRMTVSSYRGSCIIHGSLMDVLMTLVPNLGRVCSRPAEGVSRGHTETWVTAPTTHTCGVRRRVRDRVADRQSSRWSLMHSPTRLFLRQCQGLGFFGVDGPFKPV